MKNNENLLKDLSPVQKYILVLLQSNNSQSVKGNLWLQKELFLLSQTYDDLKEESEFEPYFLGPHSELVEDEFDDLLQVDLVTKVGNRIQLTSLGKEIANFISNKIKEEDKRIISDLKEFINDLTEDDLLGFIYFSYPEMRKESIKFHKIKQRRDTIALNLYGRGKISLGKASEIAGMTIEAFINFLKHRNIEVYR
jgi:predicted HTH domain antitoxin